MDTDAFGATVKSNFGLQMAGQGRYIVLYMSTGAACRKTGREPTTYYGDVILYCIVVLPNASDGSQTVLKDWQLRAKLFLSEPLHCVVILLIIRIPQSPPARGNISFPRMLPVVESENHLSYATVGSALTHLGILDVLSEFITQGFYKPSLVSES